MTAMRLKRYPSPSGGIALGKMGAGATMLKQGKTARDYVQNGLIAMWDGIENAGWGVHDPNATTWKDLIGPTDIALFKATVNTDHIYFPKGTSSDTHGYGTADFPTGFGAIEIVASKSVTNNTNDCCIIGIGATTYAGYGLCAPVGRITDTNDSSSAPYVTIQDNELFSVTLNKNGATTTEIAKNGAIGAAGTMAAGSRYSIGAQSINGGSLSVFGRASELYIRAIRIYANNLSASEIAANYAIDKERFNLP